jgi:hypothetical protein
MLVQLVITQSAVLTVSITKTHIYFREHCTTYTVNKVVVYLISGHVISVKFVIIQSAVQTVSNTKTHITFREQCTGYRFKKVVV